MLQCHTQQQNTHHEHKEMCQGRMQLPYTCQGQQNHPAMTAGPTCVPTEYPGEAKPFAANEIHIGLTLPSIHKEQNRGVIIVRSLKSRLASLS
jgi:hypothetical protein